MRLAVLWAVLLGTTACGSEASPLGFGAQVAVSGLTQAEVSSLEGFVFEPRLSNGDTILTCLSLVANDVNPRGSDVVTIASALASVNQNAEVVLEFGAVPEGEDLLVYVEAFDPAATLNGRGCVEGVTVAGGESNRVDLVVEGL